MSTNLATEERWAAIPGFSGYEASSFGRIASTRRGTWKVLKPSRGRKSKRAVVTLYVGHLPTYQLVARLVCLAFYGAPHKGFHAAHRDDDVMNDSLSNLRWASPEENYRDRDANNKTMKGDRHYAAKFSEEQARIIRSTYIEAKRAGKTKGVVASLALKFSSPIGRVEAIAYGRSWKGVA